MKAVFIERDVKEIPSSSGEIERRVISEVTAIHDENDNEVGRLHSNQWGGNWNLNDQNGQCIHTRHERMLATLLGCEGDMQDEMTENIEVEPAGKAKIKK